MDVTRRAAGLGLLAAALPARAQASALSGVIAGPGWRLRSAGVIARRRGRVIWAEALTEAGAFPAFALDAPFRIASISKLAAASVVLMDGVPLDADVSELIGFPLRHPDHPDVVVTPRMLLSHTSGLRNGAPYPIAAPDTLEAHLGPGGDRAAGWWSPRSEAPERFFAYSDTNFAALAQILERRTGVRFDRLMRERLFGPLGLDCGYNWSGVSAATRARAAAGMRLEDGAWRANIDAGVPPAPEIPVFRPEGARPFQADDYALGTNGFVFSPQGGLRASLQDLDSLAGHYAGGGYPAAGLETLWRFDGTNGAPERGFYAAFGLGAHVPGRGTRDQFFGRDSRHWRGHFGDAYGWISGLFWNARTGASLVYALNGMPETNRPTASASAITAPEELLIAEALRRLR